MLAVLFEVREVRRDDVHAEQFGVGEHHAGVDHDDVVAVAEGHASSFRTRRARPAGLLAAYDPSKLSVAKSRSGTGGERICIPCQRHGEVGHLPWWR